MKSKNRLLIDSPPSIRIDENLTRDGSERTYNQNVSQEAPNVIGDDKKPERKIFLVATNSLKKAFSDARDLTENLNSMCLERGVISPLICPVRIRYSSLKKARYAEKIATKLSIQSGLNAMVNIDEDSVSAYLIVYPRMAYLLWSEIEEIDVWVHASPEGEVGHFKRQYRNLCRACLRFFRNLKRCRYQIFPEGDFNESECDSIAECAISLCNAKIVLLKAVEREFYEKKPKVLLRADQIHKVEVSNDEFFLDGAPERLGRSVKQALRVMVKLQMEGVSLNQFSRDKFMAYYRAVNDADQHREEGTGSFDSIRRALETAFPNMDIRSLGSGEYGIQGLNIVTELPLDQINHLLKFYARAR